MIDTKKIKFILVGTINTLIDFFIFLLLTHFGFMSIFANILSTSIGVACSFALNRSVVFKSSSNNKKTELIKFLIVTFTGLWIIQNLVIFASNHILTTSGKFEGTLLINTVSKFIATAFSLVWNFHWYNSYVFTNHDKKPKEEK